MHFKKNNIMYLFLVFLLFHGTSFSQETNNLKQSDSASISGKFALDIMTWIGYTDPYSYTPKLLWPPKVYNMPGGFTRAFKDVSYRLRITYKLNRFRVGFDLLFKEILKKENLSYGMMTNGFQTISVTSDYTVFKRNKFDIGGIMAVGIYHNKNNEDVNNDFFQIGMISTYRITPKISVLISPVYSLNILNEGKKNSFILNGGIRLVPSKTDFGVKKINRRIYFSVAIALNINLSKQNTIIMDRTERYAIWPYMPKWDGAWVENENNYKNAFATPSRFFFIPEIGIHNKASSHLISAGYSAASDSININRPYTLGKQKISIQNKKFYYQYNHVLFYKKTKNYSRYSVYPYIGGQLMLNFKKDGWRDSLRIEDCNFQHYNAYRIYKDSTTLLETQFLIGFRSNHNRLFFDAGICFNLIAKESVKSNFLNYTDRDYSFSEDYDINKTIYIHELWKNHLFYDNIYFKIGYRF